MKLPWRSIPTLLLRLAFWSLLGLSVLLPFPHFGWDGDHVFNATKGLAPASPLEVWRTVGTGDAHPPLYYLLYRFWMHLGGYGEWPRIPDEGMTAWPWWLAALGFALLVAVLAEASRRLLGGWAAPLAVGLLFLYTWTPYAPFLRMYPFAALLALGAAWSYLERRPLLGSLVGTAGLYTHYLVGAAVFPFALLSLWEGLRQKGWKGVLPFAPYLAFLAWLPYLLFQLRNGYHHPDIRPEPEVLFRLVLEAWPEGVGGLFLALAGLAAVRNAQARRLLLLGAGGVYVWYLLSLGANVVYSRYIFVFAPILVLGAASGALLLPKWGRYALAVLVLGAGWLSARYNAIQISWEDIPAESSMAAAYLKADKAAFLAVENGGSAGYITYWMQTLLGVPEEKITVLSSSNLWYVCGVDTPFLLWRTWTQPGLGSQVSQCHQEGVIRPLLEYYFSTLYLVIPKGRELTKWGPAKPGTAR